MSTTKKTFNQCRELTAPASLSGGVSAVCRIGVRRFCLRENNHLKEKIII
ncbi:MAG: hypothetical protein LBH32_09115 [Dysgonamonadaceae bacterium]|jgi:hypothetical protein|nr:hypothetical protein [Dysgonamonadaceae bacterium]